jgi:hypothetical protein
LDEAEKREIERRQRIRKEKEALGCIEDFEYACVY